jgi:hypothetical protein
MDKFRYVIEDLTSENNSELGALPFGGKLRRGIGKIVEAEVSQIAQSIKHSTNTILSALKEIELSTDKYKLKEIKFSITLDAKGKAAILMLSANAGANSGIEITLAPKTIEENSDG